MDDPFGLKARIETVENNLRFFVLFRDELLKGMSEREIDERVNEYLDELSYLLRLKKDWDAF